ncbi:MAG TPA: SIMPL domain-containing protein [Polyangia bacterium]|jgi:hypothetical protein
MYKDGRFLGALALAAGLVLSTMVGSRAMIRIKSDDTIQVTGSAKRRIRSDLVVWDATVSARAADMAGAYKQIAASMPKVTAYLIKKGIPKSEIVVDSVVTTALHPHDKDGREIEDTITGYAMSESVQVRSKDVDKVTEVSREATELINDGVALQSSDPEYHYTKLGDLKIEMLAEAARDSRNRAEQIANSTGAKIGTLRSARMGVIQINPADSTEVSSEGNSDTTSIDKDIITVVASTFALN